MLNVPVRYLRLSAMRIRYIVTAVLVSASSVLSSFTYSVPEANEASSYWQKSYNKKSPLAQTFQEKHVLYRQSVLSKQEYDAVHADLQQLQLSDEKDSIAHNRIGAVVPNTSITHQIFQEGSLSRLVQSILGDEYELSKDIPVEVRVYEKMGASMDWHVDDVLYDPPLLPQVEVVWTLENTSDCTTRWRITGGKEVIVETEPNSVLLFRAGAVFHSVTSLQRGRRVIVKCAFCSTHAMFRPGAMVTQFATNNNNKKKKKKKRTR